MKKINFQLFFLVLFLPIIGKTQINWSPEQSVAPSAFGSSFPKAVMGKNDTPYISWNKGGKIYFTQWNGVNFNTPIQVNPDTIPIAGADWMGPEMAVFGDTLYFVFKATPEASASSQIWCVASYDNGQTISPPTQVTNIGTNISRFPTITVDNLGNPIVGFMHMDEQYVDTKWVVARSTNAGQSFQSETIASGWSSATSEVCDCCPGQITHSGNYAAILYRDNNSNIRDTWAGISFDNGQTFNQGLNLDQLAWNINGCPSTGPDGFIWNDTLYSVFMSAASGNGQVYFSKAPLSPANNALAQEISSVANSSTENFPRTDHFQQSAALVFQRNSSGITRLIFKYGPDLSSCFNTAGNEEVLATQNVSHPDVCLGENQLFVFWQDNATGGLKYKRGQFSNTSLAELNKTKDRILLQTLDILGRPTQAQSGQVYLYLYSDGSVEKRVFY